MIRTISYMLAGAVAVAPVAGQVAPEGEAPDTVAGIVRLDGFLASHAEALEGVWPGYRTDSIAMFYIVPGRVKVAVRWPSALPAAVRAFRAGGRTGWTDTRPVSFEDGSRIAFVPVDSSGDRGDVAGLALHEAFHAYEAAIRRAGRRLGTGENALLTGSYPLLDVENEAGVAVEGRLLRRAYEARSQAEARRFAAAFLAVRRARRVGLEPEFVEYERRAEIHEGLSQYALLRGLAILGERAGEPWRGWAARELRDELRVLTRLTDTGSLSLRRRFYATGSIQALLLDRLGGARWKARVHEGDAWLEEALAEAVVGTPVVAGDTIIDAATLRAAAATAERLQARRAALRDSLLAVPGVLLVIDPGAVGRLDWCGFDPQNLLRTGAGQTLHMRFVRLCAGGRTLVELERGAVQEEGTGAYRLRVPALAVSIAGTPRTFPSVGEVVEGSDVRIEAPGVRVDARRAVLIGGRDRLQVVLLPDGTAPRAGEPQSP